MRPSGTRLPAVISAPGWLLSVLSALTFAAALVSSAAHAGAFDGASSGIPISSSGTYEMGGLSHPVIVFTAIGLLAFVGYRERRHVAKLWSLYVVPPLMFLGFLIVALVCKDAD